MRLNRHTVVFLTCATLLQRLALTKTIPAMVFGSLFLSLAVPFSQSASAQGVRFLSPDQVDCSNPPIGSTRDIIAVQIGTGIQTPTQYCNRRAALAGSTVNSGPWQTLYRDGESICRDRRSGTDTVCLTPASAERLRWIPASPGNPP